MLAAAERHLRVDQPAALTGAASRSYLPDGRCVGWCGPVPAGAVLAVDAEVAGAPVPPALARRFGTGDFWARWTRTECFCKITGIPVVTWWGRHGLDLPEGACRWRTLWIRDLVVTVAVAVAPVPTAAGGAAAGTHDDEVGARIEHADRVIHSDHRGDRVIR